MNPKTYKTTNLLLGWLVFAIAAVTYLLTMEPTASFWDCGEFIASAYKLEVGHPPGNPFFALTGRFFANFASDPSQVALMVNTMSALFSALTILFLFWSITRLARKIVAKDESHPTLGETISVMGSALVGALVYAFSDTFWFSAVEGEVYGYSSMMTALVFWLILKWEDRAHDPRSDKWIILIAYVMGLSIGVHLLNLLCIPAIVLVYYFKKNPQAKLKDTLIALLVSFVLVAVLMYGVIPGVVKVAGVFELFAVNTLRLPYQSGLFIYLFVLLASFAWGIYETQKGKNKRSMYFASVIVVGLMGIPFYGSGISAFILGLVVLGALTFYLFMKENISPRLLNTTLLSLFVIFVGYSTFALILIRSSANPPMDQNAPDNIFALESYLNREQYGDRPLFYGQTFASQVKRTNGAAVYEEGAPNYKKAFKKSADEADRYHVSDYKTIYQYEDETKMLFPRMYSSDPSHLNAYKVWSNFQGRSVMVNRNEQNQTIQIPTFMDNIRFFFSYQMNFMYWRYFMWNFAGRQNDIQASGNVEEGNWLSGIPFVDNLLFGDQSLLPDDLKNNKARNVYFMLPLLLGILGLLWQAFKGDKGIQGFWITFFLFFMTGIAIVIYLNQYPGQPRERDYAYAGSFYAFAIWIGLGVASIAEFLHSKLKKQALSALLATLLCLPVPVLMAAQNWDDHDRSGRYTTLHFGSNYLLSCEPNAVIFTNGDNDTFPLWYAQEVEGIRTDVRVCNLSYLQADWYINQMRYQAYESDALPISMTPDQYVSGKRDVVYLMDSEKAPIPANQALYMIKSDDSRFKIENEYVYLPGQSISIPFKTKAGKDTTMIVDCKGQTYLGKGDMIMLDMLNENKWKRPIYFAVTVGGDSYRLNLRDNFSLVGMAYALTPYKTGESGRVDTEKMYDNMMNKFQWGGVETGKVYVDENIGRMCRTHRHMFAQLIQALVAEEKFDQAEQAIDRCLKMIPGSAVPHELSSYPIVESLFMLGKTAEAEALLEEIYSMSYQHLRWYLSLQGNHFNSIENNFDSHSYTLYICMRIAAKYDSAFTDRHTPELQNMMSYIKRFENLR